MYAWKITLNSVDISDKVARFSIACSLDSFCREMTLDIADPDLYAGLDFSQISGAPEIEIFTRTGEEWISQGTFFIERPALAATVKSDLMQGVWGRSLTAMLAEPFAPKITKVWEERTTFFNICQEMCDLAGFEWDPAYSDIGDFIVFSYTFEAEGVYPIDVISNLAGLAGALVTTDRDGHLCIKQIDYAPSGADVTITDDDIQAVTESPEWPTFANRVRITPTGELASFSVALFIPDPCIQADGTSRAKLYAHVRDPDGEPVDGLAVNWEADSNSAALEREASNTQEIVIRREPQRASNFHTVAVEFPPSSVDGIYAYSDTGRTENFAAAGYDIDGNTITLIDKLAYCDQSLLISYRARGMAVNYLVAGSEAEDVTVTASVEGQADSGMVYVDNPCECPPMISLTAAPTSINPGQSASLLVYAEESGPVTTGRMVFIAEVTAMKRGVLSWTYARLGTVSVINEQAAAINEIAGVTQCEIEMFAAGVASVYAADEDGNPTGANLYSSYNGKMIDLSGHAATGTALLVNYTAQGAALAHFRGVTLGTAVINAWMLTNREEGAEAGATVRIVDNSEITDDYPDDWAPGDDDGGDGGSGGSDDDDYDDGWDPGEEPEPGEGGGAYECVPENVSDDPNEDALAERFAEALALDCTCEEICAEEYNIFGTTQGYDGASGRPIVDIVTEDYGFEEHTPEHWEKYAELKAEALAQCMAECDDCYPPMEWAEDNAETIDQEDQIAISVINGVGPYTWNVEGTGFSLETSETEGRVNLLNADETACGSATITVLDTCGIVVTGYVRGTVGGWVLKSENVCGLEGSGEIISSEEGNIVYELIEGNKKQWENDAHSLLVYGTYEEICAYCRAQGYPEPTCIGDGQVPIPCESIGGGVGYCNNMMLKYYEWEC